MNICRFMAINEYFWRSKMFKNVQNILNAKKCRFLTKKCYRNIFFETKNKNVTIMVTK